MALLATTPLPDGLGGDAGLLGGATPVVGGGLSADLATDLAALDGMLSSLSEMVSNINVGSAAGADTGPGMGAAQLAGAPGGTRGSTDDSLVDESLESLLKLASETLLPGGGDTPGVRELRAMARTAGGGGTSGESSDDAGLEALLLDSSAEGLRSVGWDRSVGAPSALGELAAAGLLSSTDEGDTTRDTTTDGEYHTPAYAAYTTGSVTTGGTASALGVLTETEGETETEAEAAVSPSSRIPPSLEGAGSLPPSPPLLDTLGLSEHELDDSFPPMLPPRSESPTPVAREVGRRRPRAADLDL